MHPVNISIMFSSVGAKKTGKAATEIFRRRALGEEKKTHL